MVLKHGNAHPYSHMSYLVGPQREGDCSQRLEELRGSPGGILGVGAVHTAKEMQHAGRERPFPGVISRASWGLKAHFMRGRAWECGWRLKGSQRI